MSQPLPGMCLNASPPAGAGNDVRGALAFAG